MEETGMVREALLKQVQSMEGDEVYWSRGASCEMGLATLTQWAEFAARRGFTVTPVPELGGRILSQDGGSPYRIADPRAVPGHDVFYVLVWEA